MTVKKIAYKKKCKVLGEIQTQTALPYPSVAIEKGAFESPSTKVANFTLLVLFTVYFKFIFTQSFANYNLILFVCLLPGNSKNCHKTPFL